MDMFLHYTQKEETYFAFYASFAKCEKQNPSLEENTKKAYWMKDAARPPRRWHLS